MIHFLRRSGFVLAILASVSVANAADLVNVYQQALGSDPTFKQAHSQWLVDQQEYPLALTGDGTVGNGLFPNIDFTSQLKETHTKGTVGPIDSNGTDSVYTLTITQPVFNVSTWFSIRSARYAVRSATATYLSAGQSLINRTAVAYLEVLRDYDILQYELAAQAALLHELGVAKNKYHVGLEAKTAVYDARASYDLLKATVIKQRTTLVDVQEDLRAITGKEYRHMRGLPKNIPLIVPMPHDINAWVKIAKKQNYALQADQMTMRSARESIHTQSMSRLPTINAVGSYDYDRSNVNTIGTTKTGYVGVSLDFPLFKGGYVFASTKQARYTYLKASDTVELDQRTVAKNTRQDYLGVMSGISQIRADWVSVRSSAAQLKVTQASYVAGSRTMVDVLAAVSTLFSSIQTWSGDRYDYLESLIQLKYDAGTLSPKDIEQLNVWLTRKVTLNKTDFTQIIHDAGLPASYLTEFLGQSSHKSAMKRHKRMRRPVVIKWHPKKIMVQAKPVALPPPPMHATSAPAVIETIVILPQPLT